MSLYEDLTEILTPYADKINQNTASLDDLRDDFDNLDVETDDTLSVDGKPADAKAVGDALNAVTSDVVEVQDALENLNDAIIEKTISAPVYDSASTYNVGDYCSKDGVIYKCTEPIATAEAWNASHWTAITGNEMIADMNDKLNMLVTSQVVEQPPVPENVQCLNPDDITKTQLTTNKRVFYSKIDVFRDGDYYGNPFSVVNSLNNVRLFNAYNEEITLTKVSNGSTYTVLNSVYVGAANGGRLTVANDGYTLKTYVRGNVSAEYTLSSKVAYIGGTSGYYSVPSDYDEKQSGITYGDKYDNYVPYASAPDVPIEYELAYNLDMVRYVQQYMEDHGTGVSNRIYDVTYPEKFNSEFVNAVKYYHERADRQRNKIIRIGSFNKFVSRGQSNWSTIKQELADYSIDICGFQECKAIVSDGAVTDQIGAYLQGWQYKGYAPQDTVVDKAIVSHWVVTQTDLITLLTYDNSGTSNCIHALMSIPADDWYSNMINANATLSVYCYHGKSTGATIGGVSYSASQVRYMEIESLLAVLAQDTSDFIVIVGDTNCFEAGFDASTGTHHEWEMFRSAGYTPVLDGHSSTVTGDITDKYFFNVDGEVHCLAAYDQIFIGSNITAENFGIVDSNLYPVESLGNVPVSDHCMVYADLKFNFDAVMQAKLREIAITQPWW